nr:HlyD family secretion protein [Pseudomonadota bacterium]
DNGNGNKKPPMPRWKKLLFWAIGIAVVAILVTAGVLYWLYSRQFETTDDAFVDGYVSRVSAQVSARVERLLVQDNQEVRAGQVLLTLDPRDYQARVDQAEAARKQAVAALAQARAQLALQRANVEQSVAQLHVQQATLTQSEQDYARFKGLDPRAISRQTVGNANQTVKAGQARVAAARQAVTAVRARVEAASAQIESARAQLSQADAQLAQAQLKLHYTTVRALVDGRVTQRTVDVGNYVSPGQALLAVVPSAVWVTANFKETQLAHMKVGQRVRIVVDAYPGAKLCGRINSFQRGTGTVFSALPAENATGNYVKVVQRLPIKITFDGDPWTKYQLAPGMSVEPRVRVR